MNVIGKFPSWFFMVEYTQGIYWSKCKRVSRESFGWRNCKQLLKILWYIYIYILQISICCTRVLRSNLPITFFSIFNKKLKKENAITKLSKLNSILSQSRYFMHYWGLCVDLLNNKLLFNLFVLGYTYYNKSCNVYYYYHSVHLYLLYILFWTQVK